jgi:hypothetical protein
VEALSVLQPLVLDIKAVFMVTDGLLSVDFTCIYIYIYIYRYRYL